MTNFLPTLTSKLPSVMQATAVDSLTVVTGITQEQLTAAVDAAVKSSTEAINGDMGMLWMLLSGILVFFMQAGFTLVESGMTRSKNAVNIAMKNLLDICVGSLTYWIIGYSLMYGDTSNGWFFWSGLFQGEGADLFFQTMFAATAATIVSGAIAGRTKYSTYVIFSVVMTAIIYPISGGWQWQGSGWLTELGFIDFAGSSIVHSVGASIGLVVSTITGSKPDDVNALKSDLDKKNHQIEQLITAKDNLEHMIIDLQKTILENQDNVMDKIILKAALDFDDREAAYKELKNK